LVQEDTNNHAVKEGWTGGGKEEMQLPMKGMERNGVVGTQGVKKKKLSTKHKTIALQGVGWMNAGKLSWPTFLFFSFMSIQSSLSLSQIFHISEFFFPLLSLFPYHGV
jgi:hypothetical protein